MLKLDAATMLRDDPLEEQPPRHVPAYLTVDRVEEHRQHPVRSNPPRLQRERRNKPVDSATDGRFSRIPTPVP